MTNGRRPTQSVLFLLMACSLATAKDPDAADFAHRPTDPLKIIPADASAAIAIRNIEELTTRGDQLIAKTEARVPMRFTDAFAWLTGFLGIRDGLDPRGGYALFLMGPKPALEGLVLAVPIGDLSAMAASLNIPEKELSSGRTIDRARSDPKGYAAYVRYIAVRERHLYLALDDTVLQVAVKGDRLHSKFTAELQQTLSADDIVLYANRQFANEALGYDLAKIKKETDTISDPDQREAMDQLIAAATEVQRMTAGIRLDGGVGATFMLDFEGDRSRDVLKRFASEPLQETAKNLPADRALAVHAFRGNGDSSAVLIQALMRHFINHFVVSTDSLASAGNYSSILDILGIGWQRVDSMRTALYENENPSRDGLFSLLAIMDTDNAETFISEMTSLARFIKAPELSENKIQPPSAGEIEMLIEELGHPRFRTRQLAAVKLRLMGSDAIPFLRRARGSDDPEIRARAAALITHIDNAIASQKKELLQNDLLGRIRPQLVHLPDQELVGNQQVDYVQMRFPPEVTSIAERLRLLLGPQWRNIRVSAINEQVVLFLGSDVSLMRQAIQQLQGIGQGNPFAGPSEMFRQRATDRRNVEFHLSLARLEPFLDASPKANQATEDSVSARTSMGLSISPQRLRLDLWSPFEELRVIARRWK